MAKVTGSLGSILKQSRQLMSLTLRQVEEATGVSNAYLSQLENDRIKSPSANILYKLAKIYNTNLDTILIAAGVIKNEESKVLGAVHLNSKKILAEKITPEEEQVLLDYLRFLRYNKKAK